MEETKNSIPQKVNIDPKYTKPLNYSISVAGENLTSSRHQRNVIDWAHARAE